VVRFPTASNETHNDPKDRLVGTSCPGGCKLDRFAGPFFSGVHLFNDSPSPLA